ncbi:phosphatidate cytidylyltransferase [Candidatus Sumerlaeota bacterium]|nr:phosphatidate cytidylyltransferase [Candidatus Sumerlaeota bacterium]
MGRRVLTAFICLPLIWSMFYFDQLGFLFYVCLTGIACMCVWEMRKILRPKKLAVNFWLGQVGVVGLMVDAYAANMDNAILILGACALAALVMRMRGAIDGAAADVSVTLFSILYVGLPMAAMVRMFHAGRFGEAWIVLMFATVWMTDSVALLAGRTMGRHKFSPIISPNKTWEGAIGGLLGALTVPFVAHHFFSDYYPNSSLPDLVLVVVVMCVIAQLGDLAESMLKRDTGVKDSGSRWTGHGGFLDRMDALLFTSVALLIYLRVAHPHLLETAGS